VEVDPLIGRNIGGYEVASLLGEGAMGKVYLAKHPFIGKKIAIKSLRSQFVKDQHSMTRFFQEAKAVNAIRHENVVDIFNLLYTPESNEAYILMEYLEGRTLGAAIKEEGSMLLGQIGHIGLQLCSALAAAHTRNILHRDLKPENIFLSQKTNQKTFVKIIDFGLAKLHESTAAPITWAGARLGTPAYMSPEQFMGEKVDARTDIYSLGLILYEMATGEFPFVLKSMSDLIAQKMRDTVADPRTRSRWLPESLSTLITRCLSKEKRQRHTSVIDLAYDLAEACGLDPEPYMGLSSPELPPTLMESAQGAEFDLFYSTMEQFEEKTQITEQPMTLDEALPTMPELSPFKKEPGSS
jgi:serine/threonine protein kinase